MSCLARKVSPDQIGPIRPTSVVKLSYWVRVLMLLPLSLSWLSADGAHSAYDEAVLITVASGIALSLSAARGDAKCKCATVSCWLR